jgi:hypothetical protein
MSAEAVMILLPIVALLLGLGVLLMGYVGSVRTPVEQAEPVPERAPAPTQTDREILATIEQQLSRIGGREPQARVNEKA